MPGSFALTNSGQVVTEGDSSASGSLGAGVQVIGQGTTVQRPTQAQVNPQSISALGQGAALMAQQDTADLQGLNALSKLTDGAVDRLVAQKQQEQYFDGMAKVTQGQALQDIESQQPWYTKIFGPDATVKGAQAMTVMTQLQDMQTQFLNDMPSLKQASPDDVRQYLVKQAAAVDVGDPTVNAMIQSKVAEQWGSMLEVHMKQHYAWQQQQSSKAYGNMQLSSGNSLQALTRQGGADFLSTDKGRLVAQQTVQQIDANPGMDPDTFLKSSLQAAESNLEQGNFVYGNLFTKSQTYQNLTAEQKASYDKYQDRAENKGLQDLELSNYGIRKANLISNMRYGVISLNDGLKQASALNAEVSQATGISQPFINGTQIQAMVEGNNSAMIRAADKLQAKQDKANDQQTKLDNKALDVRNAVGMINNGQAHTAIAAGLVSGDEADLLTANQFTSLGTNGDQGPQQQAQFLIKTNAQGYTSQSVKNQLNAGVNQSNGIGYTNAFQQSLDYYTNLRDGGPGGQSAADAYFGDNAHFMDKVYSLTKQSVPAEVAYDVAKAQQPALNNIANQAGGFKQGRQLVTDAVNKTYDTWAPTWLGGTHAAPYVISNIASAVSSKADQYVGNNWDVNTAVGVAAKNSGIDLFGEDGYIRKPNQMTVAQTLHIPDDAMGPTFSALRDQKLQAAGLDKSNVQSLQRLDDPTTGKVNLYMVVANPDTGAVTPVLFRQDEISGAYNSDVVQKAVKKARADKFANSVRDQLPPIAY